MEDPRTAQACRPLSAPVGRIPIRRRLVYICPHEEDFASLTDCGDMGGDVGDVILSYHARGMDRWGGPS